MALLFEVGAGAAVGVPEVAGVADLLGGPAAP